ncbi:MAG: sulfatase [Acidobacteria bacterium]|nr:sulfatase [Acidobacteriota bacterium]
MTSGGGLARGLPSRAIAAASTFGALGAATNWAVAFGDEPYARAYLVVLAGAGAAAGAAIGLFAVALLKVGAGRSSAVRRGLSALEEAGSFRRAVRWIWVALVGMGLAALAAYLGSAPRFAPLLSSQPRHRAAGSAGPPNVILVSFDTARPDRLGAYGASPTPSPGFDALAAEGTLFTRCIASSSWTIPSTASIFTSRAPSHIGGHLVFQSQGGDVSLPGEVVALPEIFHGAGYRTAGFIGGHPLSAAFGFDQGFDDFNDGMAPSLSVRWERIFFARSLARVAPGLPRRLLRFLDGPLIAASNYLHAERHVPLTRLQEEMAGGERRFANRADEVNQKVFAWLDRRPPSPFFLFVHYFDPHDPYDPPEGFTRPGGDPRLGYIIANGLAARVLNGRGPLTAAERTALLADYDGEVAFMDRQLGVLMDRLRDEGALDDAIVAVVSDHGESFGEHGLVFHGHYLYDDLTRIVLLVRGRGVPRGASLPDAVAGADVAPTLLDLAGLASPPSFEGRSLVPLLRGTPLPPRPIVSEIFSRIRSWKEWDVFHQTLFSVELGGLKLIRSGSGRTELYDLGADPGELRDLSPARPGDVARLRGILADYIAKAAPPPADTDPRVTDDAVEGLKGLGYIRN